MNYKAYESYKDSNIPWIGDIPAHWESLRIKDCLSFKIGGTPPTKIDEYFEGENIWVSIADINKNKGKYIKDSSIKISDEAIRNSNVKLIKKGSLLYSFKLSVGLTTFAGCDLYTNEAIASFEENDIIDLDFLKYIFKVGFENNSNENIYGAKLFNSDLIKFSKFAMPLSIDEQKQIANFLDKQTSKINVTIEKNKKLILLLEEKRAALINQVVTKGLNPNVPMKHSNIEWIGNIPQHWNTYKLKHVINEFIAGGTPKSSNDAFWDEENKGIPWVAIGDMTDNEYINKTAKSLTREGLTSKNLRILKKGTLIYSIFASLGKTSILNINATTNQAILGLILSNKIDIFYLKYYLEALKSTISSYSNENTQENLNSNIVKNMEIAMPNSLKEQKEIADYLNDETSKIDRTISKIKENINLLEEYENTLIHNVVTGKIDVRGDEI